MMPCATFVDDLGWSLTVPAEAAAALFEAAMAKLNPEGITGICAAFALATFEEQDAQGARTSAALRDLAEDPYVFLMGFAPFQWLAPANRWEPYWFTRDGEVGAYEHRLTALAFMAAICRAGDA